MSLIQAIAMDDQTIQLITFLLVLAGVWIEIYQWKKEPSEKYWIISTLTWMFHALFFYVFLTFDRYTKIDLSPFFGSYTLWSGVLRLHIIGTIIILEFSRVLQASLRKKKKELNDKLILLDEITKCKELISENKILLKNITVLQEEMRKEKSD